MRILDRYILKSTLSIFVTCVFIFLFLYVVIDLLTNLEDLIKMHIHFNVLAKYYLLNLPFMFVKVAPFACLLSTLYTFSRLNHNNEIIAMRSSGLSVLHISKTLLMLGLLVSLLVFWLNGRIMPQALAQAQRIKSQFEEVRKPKEKKQEILNNLCMYGLRNRLFFINKFYTATNTMQGIIILEHDEHQNLIKKVVANRGIYQDGLWKFSQSITYNFDANGQIINEPIYMEEEIMSIPETPRDFISQRQHLEQMTIKDLDDYIWKLSRSGATTVVRNLKIDLYQKYTAPFTSLIIIILGIPFSLIMRRRAAGLSSIGISIMVGFLYYILDAVCITFGKGGLLPPLAAASLSHVIALSVGIYMIRSIP
ncbi:MAG: LptF/LptG family permease [Candidatus Omnitrophota bacterium]